MDHEITVVWRNSEGIGYLKNFMILNLSAQRSLCDS